MIQSSLPSSRGSVQKLVAESFLRARQTVQEQLAAARAQAPLHTMAMQKKHNVQAALSTQVLFENAQVKHINVISTTSCNSNQHQQEQSPTL